MSSCRTSHQARIQLIVTQFFHIIRDFLKKITIAMATRIWRNKNLMSKTIAQHVRFKKFIYYVLLARKFRQQFSLVFTLKLSLHPHVMLQGRYRTIRNG